MPWGGIVGCRHTNQRSHRVGVFNVGTNSEFATQGAGRHLWHHNVDVGRFPLFPDIKRLFLPVLMPALLIS
jgi:hypothetical protein